MCQGKRLCGAKFVLLDECGREIACAVTNECGELCFDPLPAGRYYIREICAPSGYKRSDECVEVVICEGNMHRLVEFVNTRDTGSIKVIKYGI